MTVKSSMAFCALSNVKAVLLKIPMTLSSAKTLSMVCGPTAVPTVPFTTEADTMDDPRSGLASGPISANSVPVHAYSCLAAESHQKSPVVSPLGAVVETSAPPANLNLEPS